MKTTIKKNQLGDFTRFSALAAAIFRQEGNLNKDYTAWNRKAIGFRYNNPGNLVYAGQPGAVPAEAYDPGMKAKQVYAKFDSLAMGVAATERQLALDASRGKTLRQRFSGPGAWSTAHQKDYVKNLCTWLNVGPDTPLEELGKLPRVSLPELLPPFGGSTT